MEEFEYLIGEFKKLKYTHPNLSELWIHYLIQKQSRFYNFTSDIYNNFDFYNIMEQAIQTIHCIKNNDYKDLSRENILTLYCFAHSI